MTSRSPRSRPVAYSKRRAQQRDHVRASPLRLRARQGAERRNDIRRRTASVSIYEHGPTARKRDVVGSWQTKRVPYVHTFGLTPQHAILVAHPFSVNPLKMLWSSKGYIDHFDWQPQEGTRLIVIDRASGATREHVTEPFFVFHTVNAFERDDATVLDLLDLSRTRTSWRRCAPIG